MSGTPWRYNWCWWRSVVADDGACAHSWGYGGKDNISPEAMMAVGCEGPYWLRCSACGSVRLVRCGRPSMRACGPCGLRNKSRVHRVASSGFHAGADGLFVTLTAPSWVEHFLPNGEACKCTGGDCPDLADWNASAGKKWNRLVQELRRSLGSRTHEACKAWAECQGGRRRLVGGVHRPCGRLEPLEVVYFKAAEVQRRGALHFHVLLRGPSAGGRLVVEKSSFRRLAVKHGFGHEVDVQAVQPKHWGYVAKYASKAAGDRLDVPWRGLRWVGGHRYEEHVDSFTGEVVTVRVGTAERRQVPSCRATYRTWSASRRYGDSMGYVRAAQGHWSALTAALPCWSGRENGAPALWGRALLPLRPDGQPDKVLTG